MLIPLMLNACSFQQYQAKPIDTQANLAKLSEKDPNSPAFQAFLIAHGYKSDQLPVQNWGLEDLTYCALFFHPSLDLAKAKSHAAALSVTTTSESAIPTLNALSRRSNGRNQIIKPYAMDFSVDIPLDPAKKGEIRIQNAQHLFEMTELDIAQTAWQLRNALAQIWLEYQFNQEQIQLLNKAQIQHEAILAIHEKRLALGLASNLDVNSAKLLLQSNQSQLQQALQQSLILQNQLASNAGLPIAQLKKMTLKKDEGVQVKQVWQLEEIKRTALLNRIDLRIALLRYATMEDKLKLEIANQYPDIVISPGYSYEFGDSIWSLGFSGLMTFLNQNKAAIAEARQLREVEAVAFDVLQNKIIGDTHAAYADLVAAQDSLEKQRKMLITQQEQERRMAKLLKAGQIDRLAFTQAKLETVLAEKTVAAALYQYNDAVRKLENMMEKPLTSAGVNNES